MLIIIRRRRRIVKRKVNPKRSPVHRKLSHANLTDAVPGLVDVASSKVNALPPNRGPLVQLPDDMNPYLDFLQRLPEFLTDMPSEAFQTIHQVTDAQQSGEENEVDMTGADGVLSETVNDFVKDKRLQSRKHVEGHSKDTVFDAGANRIQVNERVDGTGSIKCSLPGYQKNQSGAVQHHELSCMISDVDMMVSEELSATSQVDLLSKPVTHLEPFKSLPGCTYDCPVAGFVKQRPISIQGPHLRHLPNIRSCLLASKKP